ncbi:LIC_13387 family protein [Lacimicrobium alkaliphilum]|uniref:Uncharacterized protein n=1 Tax=Lacimicrobium alkaliphilum TaxID=1526571 RepID=A0A0U2QJX5_9ALTE|nr:hypothetical protein [Lacimicrobium alkaliphilum]ALS97435.1 hypothetical protein AT746_03535 [Lacimicrobium alkaliphilum]
MPANILMCISSATVLLLGLIHFFYTFRSQAFSPDEHALQVQMEQGSPKISNQTSMWKAWIGFNASHSLGLILFGLIYTYMTLAYPDLLFQSSFLLGVGLAMLISLLLLAKAFWFSIPLTGVFVSLLSFIASIVAYQF